jgi:predicted GH43/DUF377 family glycosyl hydrolase
MWRLDDIDLRDPAVFIHDGLAYVFFTYYDFENVAWYVGVSTTEDFITFSPIKIISPEGYASPGNVIKVDGEFILCYQQYRNFPHTICLSHSLDLIHWSEPEVVFNTGDDNLWNLDKRVIDPYLVVWENRYYCYYIGSTRRGRPGHNLIGVAVSDDLRNWRDLTLNKPAIGVDFEWEEPDGNENNCVIRKNGKWFMLYSASLVNQKIAWAVSEDLVNWDKGGLCDVPVIDASIGHFGAPFIIEGLVNDGVWYMVYQGKDVNERISFIMLESEDLIHWH